MLRRNFDVTEIPLLSKRLILMFLVSKEHTRGLWYPHILKLLPYVYVTSPFKDSVFLVVALDNMDDLGKSFCIIMCYTVTAIKHKKIESKCQLENV